MIVIMLIEKMGRYHDHYTALNFGQGEVHHFNFHKKNYENFTLLHLKFLLPYNLNQNGI